MLIDQVGLGCKLFTAFDLIEFFLLFPGGLLEVAAHLQIKPEAGRRSQVLREAKSRTWCKPSFSGNYLVNTLERNTKPSGEFFLCQTQRRKEIFSKNLAGMRGRSI